MKSREVEEVIDLYFYRPLGFVIARGLCRTDILPNHVTYVSIVLGVAPGHLLFHNQVWVTLVGILPNHVTYVSIVLGVAPGHLLFHNQVWVTLVGILAFVAANLLHQVDGLAVALLALYSQAVQNSIADCLPRKGHSAQRTLLPLLVPPTNVCTILGRSRRCTRRPKDEE